MPFLIAALMALAHPMPPARQTNQWTVISDGILAELGKTHPPSPDPYALLTAGVSVDRTNGDVYLLANNIGICKSTDQGRTFRLVSGDKVTGRFETDGGLNISPYGRKLMCFTIYGASAGSDDAGATWNALRMRHLDFGAVDWGDSGKALLTVMHEADGEMVFSGDGGANWSIFGTGFWGTGLFDHQTLLSSRLGLSGIVRSTDGGHKWSIVSDEPLAAPVMVEFRGIGYWLGEHGLLKSTDKGLTWALVGPTPKGAALGPLFGRDARHMVIGCADGLYESKDGGKTWSLAAPLAPDIKVLKGGKYGTYGWDPIHNIFYASQMSKPCYKYVVGG